MHTCTDVISSCRTRNTGVAVILITLDCDIRGADERGRYFILDGDFNHAVAVIAEFVPHAHDDHLAVVWNVGTAEFHEGSEGEVCGIAAIIVHASYEYRVDHAIVVAAVIKARCINLRRSVGI